VQYRSVSDLILPVSLLLYIVPAVRLLSRGWLTRAGVAMIVAALLPWVVWLQEPPEAWGPLGGLLVLLTALLLVLALVPHLIGVIRCLVRYAKRKRNPDP